MEEARDAVPDGQGKGTGWGLWPADAVAAEAAGLPAGKEVQGGERGCRGRWNFDSSYNCGFL